MSTFVWNSITANFDTQSARDQFVNTALQDTFFLMKESNVDSDMDAYLEDEENNFSASFSFNGTDSLRDATTMDGEINEKSFLKPIMDQIHLVDGEWSLEESWMDDNAIGKDMYYSNAPFSSHQGSWILSLDTDSPDEVSDFREFLDEELPIEHSAFSESITDTDIEYLIKSIDTDEQAYIVNTDFPDVLDLVGVLKIYDTPESTKSTSIKP
jgi:hypothetical protein